MAPDKNIPRTDIDQGIDATSPVELLSVIVVTPEATVLRRHGEFVALPLYDGELGVLPGRLPLIGRLGFGELRVVEGDDTARYYIDGGFVQVAQDVISVLTNRALPAEKIDVAVARARLEEARNRRAPTDELREQRDRVVAQSRAQLRVAERAK